MTYLSWVSLKFWKMKKFIVNVGSFRNVNENVDEFWAIQTFKKTISSSSNCPSMTEMVSAIDNTSAESSLILSFIPAIFSSSSFFTAAILADSSWSRTWWSCLNWLFINLCVSTAWLWGKLLQNLIWPGVRVRVFVLFFYSFFKFKVSAISSQVTLMYLIMPAEIMWILLWLSNLSWRLFRVKESSSWK